MEQLTVEQMAEINGGTVSIWEYTITGGAIGFALAGPKGAKAGMFIGAATAAITNLVN